MSSIPSMCKAENPTSRPLGSSSASRSRSSLRLSRFRNSYQANNNRTRTATFTFRQRWSTTVWSDNACHEQIPVQFRFSSGLGLDYQPRQCSNPRSIHGLELWTTRSRFRPLFWHGMDPRQKDVLHRSSSRDFCFKTWKSINGRRVMNIFRYISALNIYRPVFRSHALIFIVFTFAF